MPEAQPARCLFAWQLSLLVSLFFLWGAANNLNDILIRQFTKAFGLDSVHASLVQSFFYGGYFFGALPAAWLARRRGFKFAVCFGLCLFSAGALLFYPASWNGGEYFAFLGCLGLIAFGLAFLEASANPWVVTLAERRRPGSGVRALNVAQGFNPLGCIAGVFVGCAELPSTAALPATQPLLLLARPPGDGSSSTSTRWTPPRAPHCRRRSWRRCARARSPTWAASISPSGCWSRSSPSRSLSRPLTPPAVARAVRAATASQLRWEARATQVAAASAPPPQRTLAVGAVARGAAAARGCGAPPRTGRAWARSSPISVRRCLCGAFPSDSPRRRRA